MTRTFVVMIAEKPSDLIPAVALAAGLRRLGAIVWTPMAHSKPKKQLERARSIDPVYTVIVDGERATLVNSTRNRFVGSMDEMAAGLADLHGDDDPSTRIATEVIDDTWRAAFGDWDPEVESFTAHTQGARS